MKDLKKTEGKIIKLVEQLDEEKVIKIANEALKAGMEPLLLLELINEGMNRVGKLYESKDYFIADLIMAGLIFKEVLKLDRMTAHFQSSSTGRIGKIIVGTVKGDIHDIGKDIFRSMMEANGFEVIDLGVDVPKELFLTKVEEHKPVILGLSGVLTNTVESMKDVIDTFTEAGIRNNVKVIVGGNYLTEDACLYIGADKFANDASCGVKVCREWIECKNEYGAIKND